MIDVGYLIATGLGFFFGFVIAQGLGSVTDSKHRTLLYEVLKHNGWCVSFSLDDNTYFKKNGCRVEMVDAVNRILGEGKCNHNA